MNKEEYELFNYVYNMGIGEIASEDILKASELQEKILTELKSIDKAIEYITPKMIDEYIHTDYINTMLDILRGKDNE